MALANSPYTTITGNLDTTATSITVVDPAALPLTFPCLLTLGYDTSTAETVLATAIANDVVTCVRGVDGTLQDWPAGTRISRVFTAKDLNDIQTNISRIGAMIGSGNLDTDAANLVAAINELLEDKLKLVKGYLSPVNGAFYSDSAFTTLVEDKENTSVLYLDLSTKRLYKYVGVGTGVGDVGYNLVLHSDDLAAIITKIGSATLDTTAQDLSGAINEHEGDISKLTSRTDMVTGTVTLTNSKSFPFNDSVQTVAISPTRQNVNYIVDYYVSSAVGNVGDIVVSDKLLNGFKIEYTGSASSVTIKYQILGGMN